MEYKNIGTVDIKGIKTEVAWKINDFFAEFDMHDDINYQSPTFVVDNDSSWFFRLCMEWDYESGSRVTLFIVNSSLRQYSVEYELGLKKQNGRVKYFVTGIMEGKRTGSGPISLIPVGILLDKKSEFAPNNTLTVMCTLKRVQTNSTQASSAQLKLIKLDKLSENFRSIFDNKESCDVTLKVKDKEYKAHKLVLTARSSVFAANFKYDTLEQQTGIIIIPDCDPDTFHQFLEYLYCGKLEQISFSSAMNLYYTSDKYDVTELKEFCIEYLTQNLTVENICEVAAFANRYDETPLYSAVQDFFNKNACQILETSEWESLMQRDYRLANELLKKMLKMNKRSESPQYLEMDYEWLS